MSPSVFEQRVMAEVPVVLAEFGETVHYMPNGGGEREIQAIPLERGVPKDLEMLPRGLAPDSKWLVHNNATTGITSDEIDDGLDGLKIAQRVGETPVTRPILRLLKHDHSWCLIEVR